MVASQVGLFAVAGAVALAIVGVGTSIASRRVGEREAIKDVRAATVTKAKGLVEPALSDALVAGDPDAVDRLGDLVRRAVLDDSLVRVKIWTVDGRIVFSDEPRLIGTRYVLGTDEVEAVETGRIDAETSDLTKPENRFERPFGKLIEVYLPVRTPSGQPLLFEAYHLADVVEANGSRLWRSFGPIAIGALVMLELVQIPLAWSLAHRLRLRQQEREGLLRRALDASEVERRQIASDLHDGAVQDLAGVAYALAGMARQGEADKVVLEETAGAVRDSIRSLRSLVVDIYPADVAEEGLAPALTDLLARAEDRGLATELDAGGLRDPLPGSVAGLLYRAAQEGLRNVFKHAGATRVSVRVATEGGAAVLEVADDGAGFDPRATDGAAPGHVGLKALTGLVADAGGTLKVESRPGAGTTLRVRVPLP